jgi:anti-sigma regulatory factor (Ser/Thr protein kinase)
LEILGLSPGNYWIDMILIVDADLNNLAAIRRFIEESTNALPLPTAWIEDVVLAVDELATNIIRHGYRGQPGPIEIEVTPTGEAVTITLRDRAPLFDPTHMPNADVSLPLERRPVGGLGIHLVRQLVDGFRYRQTNEGGNEVTLIKKTTPLSHSSQEHTHATHH